MTDLNTLASMVEAATGFDPGLDRRIAEAVFGDSPVIAREYTRSLDAAMTLVPEGCAFEVTTTGYKPGATVCGLIMGDVHEGAYAATPALALTAAALRSRAAMGEG